MSRRDIALILSKKTIGATTVAATSLLASQCGIHLFATGGVGGVHRDGSSTHPSIFPVHRFHLLQVKIQWMFPQI